MSRGVNVRLQGELQGSIQNRVGFCEIYDSASECIRDLVRRGD